VNHLLVLDDDPRVLQLLAEVARMHRYDATLTSSTDQFLLAYASTTPSLIILDLQYQDGDGIEMLSRLKQCGCTIPILLISGYDDRVLETARRIGETHRLRIAGTFSKPLHVQDLARVLDAHREPEENEWADELRAAIDHDQLGVYYQPKVNIASGRVIGFEALVRWVHPTRGIIGPDRFIPLAETTGLILPLTNDVLHRAIVDCVSWNAAGFDLSVAVNIAAPVLAVDDLLENTMALLREHALPATRLTLEITESTAMHNPNQAIELLSRLRLREINLSLDDFGTGFSNLGLLHKMPFSELKIDKSFVMDVKDNYASQVIVQALAALARNLGLTCVAEGVENLEIWSWLGSLQIEQAQGYGIARPMAAHHVLDWLTDYAPPMLADQDHAVA
jgi:EAL domain-containing protein (putative c-di-GMP-specific phosphodiesterase class I)